MRWAIAAWVLVGCGGAIDAPDVGSSPPLDAGPAVDPAVYDCRAATAPDRASPVPLSCPTDPTCTMRMASSHRGAGAPTVLAPENTLSAIRAAIAYGADLVEIDVRPTSDDTLVLVHDDELDRTTSGTGRVDETSLAEIQALAIDADDLPGDFACERVPTFAEALDLAQGRVLLVVDASKTDRVDLIVQAIVAAGAEDRVILDHADPAVISAALAIDPDVRFLVRATTEAELDTRLAALAPARPVYVHVESADLDVIAPVVHDRDLRVFALGFGQDVTAALRGPAAHASLYEDGADLVQSNRIDLLAAFLERP